MELRLQQVEFVLAHQSACINHMFQRLDKLETVFKSQFLMQGQRVFDLKDNNSSSMSAAQLSLLDHRIVTMEIAVQSLFHETKNVTRNPTPYTTDLLNGNPQKKTNSQIKMAGTCESQIQCQKLPSIVNHNVGSWHNTTTETKLFGNQNKLKMDSLDQLLMNESKFNSKLDFESNSSCSRKSESKNVEMLKRVREICNKLNVSNFDKISDDFLTLLVHQNESIENEAERDHNVGDIISFVFERAVAEVENPLSPTHYAHMLAKCKAIRTITYLYEEVRAHLRQLCLSHFEQLFDHHDDDDGPKDGYQSMVANDRILIQEEERRRRSQGILRFFAELFNVGIISLEDIKMFLDRLLAQSPKNETSLTHLCFLLKNVGHKLVQDNISNETDMDRKAELSHWFNELFFDLDNKKGALPNKIKFAIEDVFELRKKGWPISSTNAVNINSQMKEANLNTPDVDSIASWRNMSEEKQKVSLASSTRLTVATSSLRSSSIKAVPEPFSVFQTKIDYPKTNVSLVERLFGMNIHQILDTLLGLVKTKARRSWVTENIRAHLHCRNQEELGKVVVMDIVLDAIYWPDTSRVLEAGAFLGFLHRTNCTSKPATIAGFRCVFDSEVMTQFSHRWNDADPVLRNIGILAVHCFKKNKNLDLFIDMVTPTAVEWHDGQKLVMYKLIFEYANQFFKTLKGPQSHLVRLEKSRANCRNKGQQQLLEFLNIA